MDINENLGFPGREPRDAAARLGRDLWSLVCSVPGELTSATPLIGDDYPGYRPSAFRLRFADGSVLKGRRVETPAQAEAVEHVSRSLEYRGLPRVLGRFGAALLSEWIEGQPLSASQCDSRLLRQCGALQGMAHSRPLPTGTLSPPIETIESRRARVKRGLDELVQLEVLDQRFARVTAAVAADHAPPSCASGLTYGDFCADNIVLQTSGDICFVDTETLAIQPYDYDLGRTWYRWPMQRADREAYFGGYLEHRQITDFGAHFPYWAIAAIVDGALFRSRRGGMAAATVPVQRLHTLVGDLERGIAADDAIFVS